VPKSILPKFHSRLNGRMDPTAQTETCEGLGRLFCILVFSIESIGCLNMLMGRLTSHLTSCPEPLQCLPAFLLHSPASPPQNSPWGCSGVSRPSPTPSSLPFLNLSRARSTSPPPVYTQRRPYVSLQLRRIATLPMVLPVPTSSHCVISVWLL
jgi:hypothetical protein